MPDLLYKRNAAPHIFSAVNHKIPAAAPSHRITPTLSSTEEKQLHDLLIQLENKFAEENRQKDNIKIEEAGALFHIQDRNKRSAHHSFHSSHMLKQILDQIKIGHVTSDSMSHWMQEIKEGLADGSITHDHYSEFMKELSQYVTMHTHSDSCCWFG